MGLLVGCTFAVDFEDHARDGGEEVEEEEDTGARRDATLQDSGTRDASTVDTGPSPYDPQCTKAGPVTGLPRVNDVVVDAGVNVVCCSGKLTSLSDPAHCGGCGLNCNNAGQGYQCQTYIGTYGPHAYCTGCAKKYAGNQAAANGSCASNLCSISAPFEDEGRCAPSNGGTDCVDTVCSGAYQGAMCGRFADGGPIRDPSFFCTYK